MTHGAILGGLIGLVLGGVVGIMLHFSIAVPIGLILGMACGGSFGANWGNKHKGKGPFVSWKPRHWMLAVAAFLLITHLAPLVLRTIVSPGIFVDEHSEHPVWWQWLGLLFTGTQLVGFLLLALAVVLIIIHRRKGNWAEDHGPEQEK